MGRAGEGGPGGGADDGRNDGSSHNGRLAQLALPVALATLVGLLLLARALPGRTLLHSHVECRRSPERFCALAAWDDLETLVGLSPRHLGQAALDNDTMRWVEARARVIGAGASAQRPVDVAVAAGDGVADGLFISTFSNWPVDRQFYAFNGVQNVALRVRGDSDEAVLVNVHCDSGETSPGASDNGVGCVVGLEAARALAAGAAPLPRSVIFLFNGAEESGLLGGALCGREPVGARHARAAEPGGRGRRRPRGRLPGPRQRHARVCPGRAAPARVGGGPGHLRLGGRPGRHGLFRV